MHLDPRNYTGLLAGTLPKEEARALAKHLAGTCEICERFLAERTPADELDGRGDAAIDLAFPPPAAPADDLAFARIERRLRAGEPRRRRLLAVGAVAASLLIAGVAGLLVGRHGPSPLPGTTWDGVKGEARAPHVRLRYARLDDAGEATRGQSGQAYGRDAKLVFELELDRAANVVLARVQPGGETEIFWRRALPGGRAIVGEGGRAAAYPLASLQGTQRFVVVASDAPLTEGQLGQALGAFRAPRVELVSQVFPGLSFDGFEVTVR